MLPSDTSSSKVAARLGYGASEGRVWAFQPRQHFGFEAAA